MTEENLTEVCITGYYFYSSCSDLLIDVSLQKEMIVIHDIKVDFEEGKFKITLPGVYNERFGKDCSAISFINPESLNYIENEIIKEIKSNKWIMSYLEE